MRERLAERADRLQGLDGVFQFELTGEGGGTYHLVVTGGRGAVAAGAHPEPRVTVVMSAADLRAMEAGRLNPVAAFMAGRLKVRGDLSLAMRLQSLLG